MSSEERFHADELQDLPEGHGGFYARPTSGGAERFLDRRTRLRGGGARLTVEDYRTYAELKEQERRSR